MILKQTDFPTNESATQANSQGDSLSWISPLPSLVVNSQIHKKGRKVRWNRWKRKKSRKNPALSMANPSSRTPASDCRLCQKARNLALDLAGKRKFYWPPAADWVASKMLWKGRIKGSEETFFFALSALIHWPMASFCPQAGGLSKAAILAKRKGI